MLTKVGFKKISDNVFEGRKFLTLEDFKAESTDSGNVFVSGYVNTKNKPDAYGDIPTGKNVYDLSRYNANPVLLVDHDNSAGMVAGKAVVFEEDDKGLFKKFLLMKNAQVLVVKHAIEAVKEGMLKAFSIGGQWRYEDDTNRQLLTKAIIHETSLVAIGADPRALVSNVGSKSGEKTKDHRSDFLEYLVKSFRETEDVKILQLIKQIKEQAS